MKLLHTSDWHLGARLGRHDRLPDHAEALRGLLATAEDFQPDLILHSGDIFDSTRPGYDALDVGVRALSRLSRIAPTVVICGNHDSPPLLKVLHDLAGLAEARRLWLITQPCVLAIDGLGGVAIACVPFVPPTAIADLATGDTTKFEGAYADGIRHLNERLLEDATRRAGTRGIVLYTAHLHIHGARPGNSERRITVGEDYATHVEGLHRAMYAAFGHIHDPQLLPGGAATGRYAGSLIPIDFGEATQTKQTVLVDIDDGDVTFDTADLPGGRPLTRFDGTLDELERRAVGGALDGHILKARVISDDPIPALADQLVRWSPGCVVFDLVNAVARAQVTPISTSDVPEAEPSLPDLFKEWRTTAARNARAPDRDVLQAFHKVLGIGEGATPDLGVTGVASAVTTALDALPARLD